MVIIALSVDIGGLVIFMQERVHLVIKRFECTECFYISLKWLIMSIGTVWTTGGVT
jgi:hypothetical protein